MQYVCLCVTVFVYVRSCVFVRVTVFVRSCLCLCVVVFVSVAFNGPDEFRVELISPLVYLDSINR